jgi:hypothetical protein
MALITELPSASLSTPPPPALISAPTCLAFAVRHACARAHDVVLRESIVGQERCG